MPTHYDTLGVQPSATAQEIRKAYLRRARALHPDRQQGRSPADARRAEEAMRQVNVAWNVLSDNQKRSDYDDRLLPKSSAQRSTTTTRQNGHRPSSPRRPAQSKTSRASTARPASSSKTHGETLGRSIDDEPGDGSVSVLASLPVLIIVGIALGILLVTAFGNQDDTTDNREIVPQLDSQLRDQNCFIFLANGGLQQESCSGGRAEAEVVAVVPDPGNCPAGSESVTQGESVLCYVRLVAGSGVPAD